MAKKKAEESNPVPAGNPRVSVIHLQGSPEERDWLTLANKKTYLPKATILRLALRDWGAANNMTPYPMPDAPE